MSARLASPWRRHAAAPGFEHGVDELEDGALVGGRQLLDAAEALQEPRGLRRERLTHRPNAEELVGRAAEGAGEIDEERARGLRTLRLVGRGWQYVGTTQPLLQLISFHAILQAASDPKGSVTVDVNPAGHVSVRGVSPEQLKAAVVERGKFPKP